jgi:hypothetical protein
MGSGFRGMTPNGLVGANPGPASFNGAPPIGASNNIGGGNPGPASSGGAAPIGTRQTTTPGDINVGGAFGGGSVVSSGSLNGAVSNGFGASGGNLSGGSLNGNVSSLGGNSGGFGVGSDALYYGGGAYAGGVYGGSGGYSSDPISAYATAYYTGMSNLLRSEGAYDVEESEAVINGERARTKYIDNQQKIFQARQAVKRVGMAAHAEDRETHKADRARQEEFLAAHKPQPLSHEHLDPWNGTIQWPAALMESDFDELRNSLSDLFGQKARGYDKSAVESKIDKDVQEMRDLLRSQILTIPLHDYSEARKFLDSMAVSIH